jgi:hypothetical protein
VFTLHAEVEGGPLLEPFGAWLTDVRRQGRPIVRVSDLASAACDSPGEAVVTRGRVAGRSGWVAVAGGA